MNYTISLTEEQFDALNKRRVDLIHKSSPLATDESQEFNALQEIAGQVRDANTPPLKPELLSLMDQCLVSANNRLMVCLKEITRKAFIPPQAMRRTHDAQVHPDLILAGRDLIRELEGNP